LVNDNSINEFSPSKGSPITPFLFIVHQTSYKIEVKENRRSENREQRHRNKYTPIC